VLPSDPVPARLHVLLAAEAPLAVVLRRGPSKQVCTILWNRKQDTFHLGQWLKGRIYERCSDLSPDGKSLITYVSKGHEEDVGYFWMAISEAPYLKAHVLTSACGVSFKGAIWLNNTHYWDDRRMIGQDHYGHPNYTRVDECPWLRGPSGTFFATYFARHIRDGWMLLSKLVGTENQRLYKFNKSGFLGWQLQKIYDDRGYGKDAVNFTLHHPESKLVIDQSNWEWADWDDDRIVWATEGRLETGRLTSTGLTDIRVLKDFNDMNFEAIKAPY
jgi:hypothetical protein